MVGRGSTGQTWVELRALGSWSRVPAGDGPAAAVGSVTVDAMRVATSEAAATTDIPNDGWTQAWHTTFLNLESPFPGS
ncbi:hypothetical protein E4U41_001868 [Claviceps citrina]|nr:hypothetical protein E4U41_001868 [Claviceps citrina]